MFCISFWFPWNDNQVCMLFSICPSAHTSESVSSVPVKPCRQPQCNRIILSHHHQIGEMLKTFKTTNQGLWIWPTTLGFLFSQILFIVKILGQNPISTFFKFRNPVFRQKLNMCIMTSTMFKYLLDIIRSFSKELFPHWMQSSLNRSSIYVLLLEISPHHWLFVCKSFWERCSWVELVNE